MKTFKMGVALIGATGLALTGALFSASAANASVPGFVLSSKTPWTIAIDCSEVTSTEGQFVPVFSEGQDVIVNYTNCAGFEMYTDSADNQALATEHPGGFTFGVNEYTNVNDFIDMGASGTLTLHPNSSVTLGEDYPLIQIRVPMAPTVRNPSGVLAATEQISIPATSPLVLTLPNDGNPFLLDNKDSCEIVGGSHVYTTLDVTVYKSGEYTFRYVSSDPVSQATEFWSGLGQMSDPYLAVYSSFDPANPNSGVQGCNDDGNIASTEFTDPTDPYFQYPGAYFSQSDQLMSGLFPQFTANLEPGTYTLVLMSFGPLTSEDWTADAQGPLASNVELWGPEGGFTSTTVALASTGANAASTIAYSGLALTAGAMLLAFVVRRRRAN